MTYIRSDHRQVPIGRTARRSFGAVLAAAGLFAGASAFADDLRYSDHDPLGGMRTQFVNDVWLPAIEAETGGEFEVRPFFGGVLLGSKEALGGIGQGVAELGFFYPGHYPERLVAHTIFPLFPRGPASFEDVAWFYRQVYERVPAFMEELTEAGFVPLMMTSGLPGAFAAKYEIDSLDDLKGYQWRAGDKWQLRYLENAGATPVSVPWGDVYMALQTGTIDGVFTNYDGIHMMKFHEAAPNLLTSKELWFAVPFLHGANKAWFDGLSTEQQEALRAASKQAEERFAEVHSSTFEKIRSEQEAGGATVTEMSAEDVKAWENTGKLEELQQAWVEDAKAAGLENAAEVMEQVRQIHTEAMQRQ